MSTRDELIFWFSQPPKVEKGGYNAVSDKWGNKVLYISLEEWGNVRKNIKWDDANFGNAEMVHLSKLSERDVEHYISETFENHPNAIHVIPGFTSKISKLVSKHAFKEKAKLCAVSERPNMFGSWATRILRKIYIQVAYRFMYLKYNKYLGVFLPLGECGVDEYVAVGWSKDIMFPFMYCPVVEAFDDERPHTVETKQRDVHFLYVGRFMYHTKGIDCLCEAIDRMGSSGWSLDMVGGYGKNRDEMLKWIDNHENVHYLGIWESQNVIRNINNYDAVIVPSKYEGWNMIVYEAIMAGVGAIVTDQATSDELTKNSGAGVVVKAYDPRALQNAIEDVLTHPDVLNTWKERARAYQSRITPDAVSDYFIDIMDWTFYNQGQERPKCPWINY